MSTSSIWTPASSCLHLGDFRSLAHDITGYLDWNRCGHVRPSLRPMWLHEGVTRSFDVLYYHGTCLNIDFHGMERAGESYGGYDRRSAMTEGILVAMKAGGTGLPVCRVFGDLQQRLWQEGVAAQVDCIFCGAP